MAFNIYTGVWTDWMRGSILGATLTLTARDASLLLAFIAAFVTVVAARLWLILSFILHQSFSSGGQHDGLHYQRQHILRNSTSPASAIWLFLQQAWYWRGIARRTNLRTLPWVLFGVFYIMAFAVLAIFSSQISDSASEYRLVARQDDCGLFIPADRSELQRKETFDNYRAAVYSQQCYHDSAFTTEGTCNALPQASLAWFNASVPCPFNDRICLGLSAFKMETGWIDSFSDLGINEPSRNRITYKRETICSPLVTQPGFAEFVSGDEAEELGWDDDILLRFYYGPIQGPGLDQNHTHSYNTYGQNMLNTYTTWPFYSLAGDVETELSTWRPIPELALEDRDISILLIAPNSVIHLEQNNDPVFRANVTRTIDGIERYLPDRYVSPIACADAHKICNPNSGSCTPWQGSTQVLQSARKADVGLNKVQMAIAERLGIDLTSSTFYHAMWTRTQSFLRAHELVSGLTQLPLPDNQWEIEMASLFAVVLSRLQYQILEYATGPESPAQVNVEKVWDSDSDSNGPIPDRDATAAHEQMCRKQRVKIAGNTLNFSVLGLSLLVGFGVVIIFASFTIQPLAGWFQTRYGRGAQRHQRWILDDSLQQLRMLLELGGVRHWKGELGSFPRTVTGDTFEYDARLGMELSAHLPVEETRPSHNVPRKPLPRTSRTLLY